MDKTLRPETASEAYLVAEIEAAQERCRELANELESTTARAAANFDLYRDEQARSFAPNGNDDISSVSLVTHGAMSLCGR